MLLTIFLVGFLTLGEPQENIEKQLGSPKEKTSDTWIYKIENTKLVLHWIKGVLDSTDRYFEKALPKSVCAKEDTKMEMLSLEKHTDIVTDGFTIGDPAGGFICEFDGSENVKAVHQVQAWKTKKSLQKRDELLQFAMQSRNGSKKIKKSGK
jgi:hypothetical protein